MSLVAASPSSSAAPSQPNQYDAGLTPETIELYKTSAGIANEALKLVLGKIAPGQKIYELCQAADDLINDRTSKTFAKKKFERGIAFPTCISVNNCVGHFSPLEDSTAELKEGDLVKVDLGVHMDGYIACAAKTVVVGANPIVGRAADVIAAAHHASEIALRHMKPGCTNQDVTAAVAKVAEAFKCKAVQGVLSHQLTRFVIDGPRVISNADDSDHAVDTFEFAQGEAYCLDIVMSTGEGKPKEGNDKPTIFRKNGANTYSLKMKSARAVFGEIIRRFPAFPFSSRALEDKRNRLGLVECITHDLIHSFPVLYEKQGELVAQVKITVLITPSGIQKITESSLPALTTENVLTDELKKKLNESLKTK